MINFNFKPENELEKEGIDNIPSPFPPRQAPVAARYGLFHALP